MSYKKHKNYKDYQLFIDYNDEQVEELKNKSNNGDEKSLEKLADYYLQTAQRSYNSTDIRKNGEEYFNCCIKITLQNPDFATNGVAIYSQKSNYIKGNLSTYFGTCNLEKFKANKNFYLNIFENKILKEQSENLEGPKKKKQNKFCGIC